MVFWGMSFVWSKIVLQYYDPITTVLLRLIISTVIMFIGLKLFNRLQRLDRKDYKLFLFSALFNPFLYFLGENYGLKHSSATLTAVIIATIPVFTPVLAYFLLKERLTKLNIFGLFISFFGVLFMLVNRDYSFNVSPVGIAWLALAVLAAVFYSVLLKKLALKYNPFLIIAIQNLIGAIYFMPLFFIFDFKRFIQVVPNTELVTSLLLLAIFASSLAYVFFTISAREIGISKTNLFANLIPVFTAIFAFFILKEDFDIRKITGMIIVIGGVFLSQVNRRKKLFGGH
ncbi:MAG: hypothetical protein B6D64_06985 [Bacteroidetes bacterium 4484_276]|nr:MAG: hypothetical protein B6D64_06985 [Bacteroidetes bacterium 4484_276]OYT13243.1 MAG: EamA family transporter [Bacteroidetes bacterium 4572_114]